MEEFKEIYLSWRIGQGKERHIVGILRKAHTAYTFTYDPRAVEVARRDGFTNYVELPYSEKPYHGEVLDVFARRIIQPTRMDVQSFYDFWEIDRGKVSDKFYMLGHTQGLLPTDNFELLADYYPVDGLHFLTDLANVSTRGLQPNIVKIGDELTYELESQNKYDESAVAVFKDSLQIGYIKKIHCKVFHKIGSERLKLTIKAIDQNGLIKKIFVRVSR